jgi:ATP-dependent Lhr-like helicase
MEAVAAEPQDSPGPAPSPEIALVALSEPVRRWFAGRFAVPTAAQRLAWPALATGRSLLLGTPTGSGKTLAAFLPIVDDLVASPAHTGVRCVYVAPLRALIADIRKNLRMALRGIRALLPLESAPLRVGFRTGDTSKRTRRRLERRPPDILLTTPESLALMLSQADAAVRFASLRWLVIDEVHALAGSKRGADLALSAERLEQLAGHDLRRVGLSATCLPGGTVARFLVAAGRPCAIALAPDQVGMQLRIEPLPENGAFLPRLVDRLVPEVQANRTTLIFTNTRGLAERVCWALLRRLPGSEDVIAVHHSSIDITRRRSVERRLKAGRLRAVVTTTGLELGIDIGSVDAVVLVHPPGGVVRLLQRVGRAGHGPGRPRSGLVLTAGPAELLEAVATVAAGRSALHEPLRVPDHPLDVLCQHLLGMAASATWSADAAFDLVRRAYPYRDLARADFDDCLDYLTGCDRSGHAWLPARLQWSDGSFRIVDTRTARIVRRNLGTILSDGARAVRVLVAPGTQYTPRTFWDAPGLPAPAPVGAVDEAFADRLLPGDRFLLDGRCLEVKRSDAAGILVEEAMGRPAVPRWGVDGWPLSIELALRVYCLRVRAAEALRDGADALAAMLRHDYALPADAAHELVEFFQRQDAFSEIPDRGTCLIETVRNLYGADYYVHTPLNRAGNDALARVAVRRLIRSRGGLVLSQVADLGFMVSAEGHDELTPEQWTELLAIHAFEDDLAAALADSPALRERFRQVALTALMLLRNPLGRRRRVGGTTWAQRRLFSQVNQRHPDFVLLRQARREVRDDHCDVAVARAYLADLQAGSIRCRSLRQPSPFVESWTQPAPGHAETIHTPAEALQRLHASLTGKESAHVRPRRMAVDA